METLARESIYGNLSSMELEDLLRTGTNAEGPAELRTLGLYEMSPLAYELVFNRTVTNNARCLVKYGANINAKCLRTGKSILELCQERGNHQAVAYLIQCGAKKNESRL